MKLSPHSPQEEAGGVQHALQGSQVVRPLAALLHPEEHVFAQALELRQLLSQLLGGCRVAVLVHPLRCFPEFSRDLLFLLLRQNKQVFLLVKLVLTEGQEAGSFRGNGLVCSPCKGLWVLTCVSKIKASRLLRVFSRSCLAVSLSVRSCNLQRHGWQSTSEARRSDDTS